MEVMVFIPFNLSMSAAVNLMKQEIESVKRSFRYPGIKAAWLLRPARLMMEYRDLFLPGFRDSERSLS